jgi:hypothetical protein
MLLINSINMNVEVFVKFLFFYVKSKHFKEGEQ